MKLKTLKSVIHNFAHSLQSYDYTHSGKVVFDVLAKAYCENGISTITFDFINGTILPVTIENDDSKQILKDYSEWLPELANSQNASASEIEQLVINISVDFEKHKHPPGMDYAVELEVLTEVRYKIKDRNGQNITISEIEVYGEKILPEKLKQFLWGVE